MNTDRLYTNLTDNIHEAQLKLGYDALALSLNYTSATLRHLAGTDEEPEKILDALRSDSQDTLGVLSFHPIKDGFCITVPKEGTEYVHSLFEQTPDFLTELVEAVRSHASLDEVAGWIYLLPCGRYGTRFISPLHTRGL